MPPFIGGRKRRSDSPLAPLHANAKKSQKLNLFDAANARPAGSLKANQDFVNQLAKSDSDTSLSDVDSVEFEDVPVQHPAKKRKLDHQDEDEDEIDWEDAVKQKNEEEASSPAAQPSGDLELTLDRANQVGSFTNPHNQKKGPSKIERQIRVVTHCMHVQFLLFHNSLRSRYACDAKVHKILVDQLPPMVKKEVETWKLASGLSPTPTAVPPKVSIKKRAQRYRNRKVEDVRSQRDWGQPAERQEKGAPNMSRGDPVIRLLRVLAAYWKKRFTITAPRLRKQGYKPLARLEAEIASFKNDKHDFEEHGEKIGSLDEFRDHAKKCEGSQDLGVQLFVALLRGLGLEARLVASLQPVGFGWNKNEEAAPAKKKVPKAEPIEETTRSDEGGSIEVSRSQPSTKPSGISSNPNGSSINGSRKIPINLSSSSSSELSSPNDSSGDESIVDVTPSTPRQRPNMPYDRDLIFPSYWAEVISPVTKEVYPVDPLILTPSVATNPEHLAAFEPRGAKADKAKQVFAYVIAYSPDGSAKEVTTRYLKKHMWPGRTKGNRLPLERIPVHDKKGKIKHHEDYDWFKTVMSGYTRPDFMRTAVDDIEEAKDLRVVKPEKKKEAKANEGTLQFYKTSAEYVLERHLRREEAIIPGAEPVKTFTPGKGDDVKEEPVFLRKDVLVCRTGESWHKEGRQIKPDQRPMKMVPIRAVTLTRKREVEEAERDGGEKLKQGLYAWDQTEWIIPAPIVDGVIPKNAYGNMDCFVPTMVPAGAAHIPLRSTAKICKRLGIDFAEAVTGFEFGKQRAVPVVSGVVVAKEHEKQVIKEWERDEQERKIKEEGKREKAALAMWKKLIIGLRIIERVRDEYGDGAGGEIREEHNPFTNKKRQGNKEQKAVATTTSNGVQHHGSDKDMAGGFIADADDTGGGFLPADHRSDNNTDTDNAGGFLPDNDTQPNFPPHNLEIQSESGIVQKPNGLLHHLPTSPPPHQLSPPPPEATPTAALSDSRPKRGRPPKTVKPSLATQFSDGGIDNGSQAQANVKPSGQKKKKRKADQNRKSLPVASTSSSARRAPKREAATARRSEGGAVVRSKYFEGSSEDEE
ncbi:MAG: hypothetical protein Q9220_007167 [cf. Caloplaca sp. 1 TL-2023]